MFDVVLPTVGRRSLTALVSSLSRSLPATSHVYVVDDRRAPEPLAFDDARVRVLASGGKGPAAARNVGWRASRAPWVVFLDDDVHLPLGWTQALEADLAAVADDRVAAVQGQVTVPLPAGRRPTDWERNTHGLDHARWITADMALRRDALVEVGGFDERFPRAYREDSDLALRLLAAGWRLELGDRRVRHPVRPAPWWVSLRLQRGNADDVLVERLHGPGWRDHLGAPSGTYRAHRTTFALLCLGGLALAAGRHRAAGVAATLWAWRTARFAWTRIAPGPRTPGEVAAMAVTSIAIPPAACTHRALAHVRHRRVAPGAGR